MPYHRIIVCKFFVYVTTGYIVYSTSGDNIVQRTDAGVPLSLLLPRSSTRRIYESPAETNDFHIFQETR